MLTVKGNNFFQADIYMGALIVVVMMAVPPKNAYRIYSSISRGFLDNFLIKIWVGRFI